MTTGRITTALGAVALGLATAAAVPALAQTNTGGTNQPSATTSTPPATSAAPATPAAPATGTAASGSSTATMPMGKTTHAATATHTHPMSRTHMAAGETHHGMRHVARANESNPNAQDPAIDRLNQESLQAAQQGKPFTPSGKM